MIKFNSAAVDEVIKLKQKIRKIEHENAIRQVEMEEKHEKELANQRAQLTSNAALWDQLAEAEKRE